jgi:ABC-type Co2+ transport system permease subunit
MLAGVLRVHEGLLTSGRVPSLARPGRAISAIEIGVLMLLGAAAAAATMLLNLQLRIPGHAILQSVFPMALGMALVPRRLAGSIMGVSALATALCFQVGGAGGGPGAITSLALTGPLLDVALLGARQPWRLYLGFVLAGLGSNLVAFFVRWSFRAIEPGTRGGGGGRSTAEWLAVASWTYVVCGILAGLISALVWFHLRPRREPATTAGDAP